LVGAEAMTSMDLLYSDDEELLRDALRRLLVDRCDLSKAKDIYDGDRSMIAPLWMSVAQELGLAGTLIPQDVEGAGLSAREAAVILEEVGFALAPIPFLTSAVVGTTILIEPKDDLLPQLATGQVTVALAVPFTTAAGDEVGTVHVDEKSKLCGEIRSIAGALEADYLLVPVRAQGGTRIFAVDTSQVDLTAASSLDMTRQLADAKLEGCEGRLVLENAEHVLRQSLLVGAAMIASEQIGIARWCLQSTVKYLMERRQFGRVLGGYQALKHRLADLYVTIEAAAAAARYASATLAANDEDFPVAAAVAKSACSEAAVLAAEEALQLHGGIGMTWEYPVHLYLKRAKSAQLAFGTPGAHRQRLSTLVNLSKGCAANG
jgi:alkylation response protein AidB-like acyl-CoA dehydrogenase